MTIEQLFFELIQVAIGTRQCLSHTPSADEWKQLYDMAKKQSLLGVCFAGVQRLLSYSPLKGEDPSVIGITEMLYLTWMGMAAKIQQRNETVNRQCVELQKRLAADGFRSCILKGQGVAQLYKMKDDEGLVINDLSGLRQSGDIDVWVEGDVKALVCLAERIGQKANVTEQHVDLDVFEGTKVEAHFTPSVLKIPWVDKRLQQWFKEHNSDQFEHRIELGICAPTVEFNLVYLIIHIYRHLFGEGVGLRQVMDYYFVLCAVNEAREQKEVLEVLKSLGLMNFAGGLMYVMHEVFGLQHELMLCEPNEKHGRFLLNEIMLSGNMGYYDERTKKADRSTRWKRFCLLNKHNMRLLSYYPEETLWAPISRIRKWAWRKWNGWL